MVEEVTDWAERDFWIWNRKDAARYFVAGGGQEKEFESRWNLALKLQRLTADSLKAGEYVSAGGGLFYLIHGRKPEQA